MTFCVHHFHKGSVVLDEKLVSLPFTTLASGKASIVCSPIRAAATMRNQMIRHSGPHIIPHLLELMLLTRLAIVTDCIEVPLHAIREVGIDFGENIKANNMVTTHCRLGHEVGCSIAVHDPRGFSKRSRKELLFPVRSVSGQPKQNCLPQNASSRSTNLPDSRLIRRSAAPPGCYINRGPNLKSNAPSMPRMSSTNRLRSQSQLLDAEQILSRSLLRSSSRRNSLYSYLPSGLSKQEVGPLGSTTGNDSVQFSSTRQLVSRSNFGSSSAGNGTVHSASRRLGQENEYPRNGQFGRKLPLLSPGSEHDMEHDKSHQRLEGSELIPVDTDGQNLSISKQGHPWTAPPMESGPLITITVSQGEDAEFSSIQKAVDSVPERNTQRIVIRIHAGTYREKVLVPNKKPFITFHGDESGGTVVSWNSTASTIDGESDETRYETIFAREKFNATSALYGTMKSASVTILSDGFVAQHMVFQNSAPPPEPGAVGAQAVAFLIKGDRAAFYHCSFLGAQDTLYDYTGRHYYMNCYIEGSIDFIFGNGRSLFEGCHLHSIATSFGAIAAHQRLSPDDDTGFSFDRCSVTGSGTLYLGRAWSPYARIVFARTYLDNIISAEGWSDFGDPRRQSTTFFGQYQLTGPGANISHRAPWAKLLTEADVLPYLGLNFVNGGQWLGTAWPNGTGT